MVEDPSGPPPEAPRGVQVRCDPGQPRLNRPGQPDPHSATSTVRHKGQAGSFGNATGSPRRGRRVGRTDTFSVMERSITFNGARRHRPGRALPRPA